MWSHVIFIFVDYTFLILVWYVILFFINSKYSFRYVFSYENLVREDFEKNNFTKLGRITGLGRGTKSLERKFCNIYTIEERKGGFLEICGALSITQQITCGISENQCRADRVQGIGQRFSLLASYSISTFYRNATPPLLFSSSHPRDLGIFLFPFTCFFFHVPLLFSSRPFWPFTDNVTITSQCSGPGNRGHLPPLPLSPCAENQKVLPSVRGAG